MSKTITAVAVMVAVQDGLLELDVPIIEYFPQFTVNSRFEENPHKEDNPASFVESHVRH